LRALLLRGGEGEGRGGKGKREGKERERKGRKGKGRGLKPPQSKFSSYVAAQATRT